MSSLFKIEEDTNSPKKIPSFVDLKSLLHLQITFRNLLSDPWGKTKVFFEIFVLLHKNLT